MAQQPPEDFSHYVSTIDVRRLQLASSLTNRTDLGISSDVALFGLVEGFGG